MSDTEEDLSYPLDLTPMRTSQLNDEGLMSIVINSYIASSGPDNTIYTYMYKYVEGIELVHKNNRIMVLNSKQQKRKLQQISKI